MTAKAIMIQGTSSGAGKSLVAAGLCRLFHREGLRVAPFKSQNMALNSFVTREGLEMGRAQVVQAEAAGVEPTVAMNPILLKPTGEATSQVIVDGEVVAVMDAREYYREKHRFVPAVQRAYGRLAAEYDVIVIEGAGSPAEINLAEGDFVNMGMAAMADAPVLLVGDIDRGGVFASLYGTCMLLPEADRRRIRGFVVNKFRGDVEILRPGLVDLEKFTGVPTLGVVPWLDLDIEDEDGLTSRIDHASHDKPVDIAVIRFPRIANFTDFDALARHPALGIRYVHRAGVFGEPDLVILPGSKNTMADLAWLEQNHLDEKIKRHAAEGRPVIGICGGYQMLGGIITDDVAAERRGTAAGLGLIPAATEFAREKTRTRVDGVVREAEGFFACLAGAAFSGYEIHMGLTELPDGAARFAVLTRNGATQPDGVIAGNILGTYVHGLFDRGDVVARLANALLAGKNLPTMTAGAADARLHKERQYDRLAAALENALDMKAVRTIAGL